MLKLILLSLSFYYVNGQINTSLGLVSGVQEDGNMAYLGIPYAKVDENNPFGPSQPHPPYEGIFNANDDSAICPQIEEFGNTPAGSLDCLHLNVFVPPSEQPLPVLVWIYGGRFEFGFYGRYLYGPKYIIRHDVILITVNYRVGPYGFMCTDNERVPGNQGLKDQLEALRWVQENIANFGGDPNRVTLAGNSAGSMSTDFQILRNHEPRLFQQAIMQSGTSLAPSFPAPDKEAPIKLAAHFGYVTDSTSDALDFLTDISPLEVVEASVAMGFAFRPCIEEQFQNVEPFIDFNWVATDNVPLAQDLNVIVGFNEEEGLMAGLSAGPNFIHDSLVGTFDIDSEDFHDLDVVRNFFYGDREISEVVQGSIELRSDLSFIYPSLRTVDKLIRNGVGKAYIYLFSYAGGRNFGKFTQGISIGGASHADEIGYLFDITLFDEPSVEDQLTIDRMTEMWANFVKYSDPTPQITNLLPTPWLPATSNAYNYMDIGSNLESKSGVLHERRAFWDLFFEKNWHLNWYMIEGARQMDKKVLDEAIPY